MRNSKDFIISRIEEIALLLPGIQLRYEHREIHGEHIVEVSPKYFYEDGSPFESFEVDLYKEFLTLFPEETILVIPPDDLIRLSSVTHTACSISKSWIAYKENSKQYDVISEFHSSQVLEDSKYNYAKAA
jgi:hypothetical protein